VRHLAPQNLCSSGNVVVIGGTGLIGSKTIVLLRRAGHDALAAASDTGVNTAETICRN